jgi:hypothetical protein
MKQTNTTTMKSTSKQTKQNKQSNPSFNQQSGICSWPALRTAASSAAGQPESNHYQQTCNQISN